MNPDITLRLGTPGDYEAVNALIREAFWGYRHPTCDEHYLAHLLRRSPGFVPQLDYVAEVKGRLAGNVLYSMASLIRPDGRETPVLNFGPLSVHPDFRYTGVGGALMRHTIDRARDMGHGAIVFFGHPDYYPRLGFGRASDFGICTKDGKTFDAHMAMELMPGYLADVSGSWLREDAAFAALEDEAAFAAFDRGFPPRQPAHMPSAEPLLARLSPAAAQAIEAHKITTLAGFFTFSGREIAAWPGIDSPAWAAIDAALTENGYPKKVWPET